MTLESKRSLPISQIVIAYRLIFFYQPDANHPYKQHHDNYQDNASRYAASDVEELRLFRAVFAGETAAASTRGLPARVFQADALVVAEAQTHVRAHSSGAVVPRFTFTFEVARFRYK